MPDQEAAPPPHPHKKTFATALAAGARDILPAALGVICYGSVYGILARQAGVNVLECGLLSGLVFAGASQFVALDLWVRPLPVFTLIFTTFIVNLRHVLMGAALSPHLRGIENARPFLSSFFITDENWALTMAGLARKDDNVTKNPAGYLVGSGLMLYGAWLCATVASNALGGMVQDPAKWGMDFAFTAVFLFLIVSFWRGKGDILPWAVAAAGALLGAKLLPGKWYILIGGLSGSLVGAFSERWRS